MSKYSKSLDSNLELNCQVEKFATEKAMLEAVKNSKREKACHADEFQLSAAIAESIKDAIAESGLSRENVVDRINGFFGRSRQGAARDFPTCRNPLTINTFNNYLSKPAQCPIPAYYLFAIQRVTGSLAPASTLAAAEGAHVVSGKAVAHMVYGSLEAHISEARIMQQKIITENGAVWLN